jgi:branched-chain amino acid transport system permease protein
MTIFLQIIVSGLLLGGIYALLSVGLTLIFGVIRVLNFAHGDLMMLGMYVCYWVFRYLGMDPYVSAILLAAPILFIIGLGIQRGIIQPLLSASPLMQVFGTFGLSITLQNLALMAFKGDFRTIMTSYATDTLHLMGVSISITRLIAFALSVVILAALYLVLNYTLLGRALRAVAENRMVAQLMGIPVNRVYLLAFGIGSALTAMAGGFLTPFTATYPTIGAMTTLIAFVVVVLGGLGNMVGAFLGGLVIGLVESLAGSYVSPALKEAFYFLIFIVVLIIRPQGLFGLGKGSEEVGLK